MDGEDNIDNPSPGGEMEHQEEEQLHDENLEMEPSQEGGEEGANSNEGGEDEDAAGDDQQMDGDEEAKDGDGSPVSKKSRQPKKKQSIKPSEAEKSKDLSKEPRKCQFLCLIE